MKIVGVTFDDSQIGVRFERASSEDAAWKMKGKALEKLFDEGPIYGGVTIIVEAEGRELGRDQRNAARRARYAENKKRIDACDKFSGEIMRQETPKVLDYLERCIREDRVAKIDDIS